MATIPAALPATAPAPPYAVSRTPVLLGLRVTFGGILCAAIVALVGLAGLNSEANLLYLLTGISIGVLVFSAITPIIMVRGIVVERLVPEAVVAGRPFRISYVVRNGHQLGTAWGLVISERPLSRREDPFVGRVPSFPDAFAETLAPGEEKRIDVMGLCPNRGRLKFPGVRVVSRFPFGLFSCHVDFPTSAEVLVFPPLGRFRHDPWRDYRISNSSSNKAIRNRSGHEEFYGVREYRQGDNLKWIHWRQSARTGELVVREMIPIKPTQLIVLLDPWSEAHEPAEGEASSDDPTRRTAELVISAAATALCDALERGYRVGLICRAARPVVIPPAAGRAQRQRILQELAAASPGASESLDAIVGQIRWSIGWHARCLLCSATLTASLEKVVRFLNTRAEAVALLSPQNDDFLALFEPPHEASGGAT